jgi:hypothetical protein
MHPHGGQMKNDNCIVCYMMALLRADGKIGQLASDKFYQNSVTKAIEILDVTPMQKALD